MVMKTKRHNEEAIIFKILSLFQIVESPDPSSTWPSTFP